MPSSFYSSCEPGLCNEDGRHIAHGVGQAEASSLLDSDLQLLMGHVIYAALVKFTFYLPKCVFLFIMTSENGLWTTWSSAD